MIKILGFFSKFLGSGIVDRALDTVDKKIENETNRDKIKGDIIQEHLRTRSEWLRSGGFWLLVGWSTPALFWYGSVSVYSVLWCSGCIFPQDWTIAALPSPLDQWGNQIMLASIGALGLTQVGGVFKK